MDEKIKELIAIGASTAVHCQPCLKYHIEQAQNLGISAEEITAAIEVGKTTDKGAMKAMDNFAKEQIESLSETKAESPKNCCCSANSNCSLSSI